MTNSLALGCDCKGLIHYLDADFPTRSGEIRTIKNAICIHEEDSGILFKHTDFRDDSVIVTRGRKLIIQQIFTAANYEYAIQVSESATSEFITIANHSYAVDIPCKPCLYEQP
jgi:primary-amine oxidase